ncbi:MAG: DNA alkylation repair protein [Limisphaerales bacterium]
MAADEKSPERKAFKDWFDREAAVRLAGQFDGAWKSFDQERFTRIATKGLTKLEFNGRVQQFSRALQECLPPDMPKALNILARSLPAARPGCEDVTDGWLQWPLGQFIAEYGVEHFEESMTAMIELTQRFSSEFAVRPFVEQHTAETFTRLQELVTHPNPHVRRWCSEGVRPRLPWGKKLRALVDDPSPIWPILEALKDDSEIYVRRSVANNLNDIAKDHPDLVVARCRAWSRRSNELRNWVIRHALRSLIKDGHRGALAVVGFKPPDKLSAQITTTPKRIAVGDVVEVNGVIRSQSSRKQRLAIDYVVHYVRKGGKSSGKVFKWTVTELSARGTLEITKRHPLKITTIRALYPGHHRIELQINGVRLADAHFELA